MSSIEFKGQIPQHGYDAAKEFTENMHQFGFNRGIGGQKSAFLAGYKSAFDHHSRPIKEPVVAGLPWVSVDKKPKKFQNVVAWTNKGHFFKTCVDASGNWDTYELEAYEDEFITHYLILSSPGESGQTVESAVEREKDFKKAYEDLNAALDQLWNTPGISRMSGDTLSKRICEAQQSVYKTLSSPPSLPSIQQEAIPDQPSGQLEKESSPLAKEAFARSMHSLEKTLNAQLVLSVLKWALDNHVSRAGKYWGKDYSNIAYDDEGIVREYLKSLTHKQE